MEEKKKKFTTMLRPSLADAIKIQAINEHRSVANIIEELIKKYLQEKKAL